MACAAHGHAINIQNVKEFKPYLFHGSVLIFLLIIEWGSHLWLPRFVLYGRYKGEKKYKADPGI